VDTFQQADETDLTLEHGDLSPPLPCKDWQGEDKPTYKMDIQGNFPGLTEN
jgi:hypothetical protein